MLTPRLLFLLPALLLSPRSAPPTRPAVALRTIHDAPDRLTFVLPADWSLSTHDRELSTFHDEARTAPRTARLRFVAALPENPYPESTFSGAHFYVSVTPAQTFARCAAQAIPPGSSASSTARWPIDDRPASHGHDEHAPSAPSSAMTFTLCVATAPASASISP